MFKPIFSLVELFTPAAAVAIQAYPNPGSLVLGGIVGVLQITRRIRSYQERALQMLEKMSRMVGVLFEYGEAIYKEEYAVKHALLSVYGDIVAFCRKAFRFVTEHGHLLAKVKGVALLLFRDFDSHLGKEVHNFEGHLEELQGRACACDRRRLKALLNMQERQQEEAKQHFAEEIGYFRRQEDFHEQLLKRDRELQERMSS